MHNVRRSDAVWTVLLVPGGGGGWWEPAPSHPEQRGVGRSHSISALAVRWSAPERRFQKLKIAEIGNREAVPALRAMQDFLDIFSTRVALAHESAHAVEGQTEVDAADEAQNAMAAGRALRK